MTDKSEEQPADGLVCDMPNCANRAPVDHPFCAKHRIDCHSTHCERRGECASPNECGDRNALLRGFDSIMGAPDYKPDKRREILLAWAWANFGEIRAALSRPTLDPHTLEEAGWMRIEDGGYPKGPGKRAVLLYGEIGGIYIGSYISDRHSEEPHPWFTNGRHTQDHQTIYPPSHWRPLPGPPAIRNMGESHD